MKRRILNCSCANASLISRYYAELLYCDELRYLLHVLDILRYTAVILVLGMRLAQQACLNRYIRKLAVSFLAVKAPYSKVRGIDQ